MDKYLRKCSTEELDVLSKLSIETFYKTFAHLNTKVNIDAYLQKAFNTDKLKSELSDKNSEFYFLHYGDQIAGYLKLNKAPSQTDINDPDSLEIERIYVLKEFQGLGLGRYLMEQTLFKAVEYNKKYVWLGVWEKNEKAIRFYKNNGFSIFDTHKFAIGEDAQTDYLMKKEL